MIIILEGVDGSGKTTVASMLAVAGEKLYGNSVILHKGPPERHPLLEYELDLEVENARRDPKEVIICDRWHIGELIYGDLYRGGSTLGPGGIWHVNAVLQAHGAKQYIMAPPPDIAQRRAYDRGETYLKREHFARVYDQYIDYAVNRPLDVEVISTSLTWIRATELIEAAYVASTGAQPLVPYTSYVGPPEPDMLLIVPPSSSHGITATAPPFPGTIGEFICNVIASTDLVNMRIGMVSTDEANVSSLVTALGNPKVVTLGAEQAVFTYEKNVDSWNAFDLEKATLRGEEPGSDHAKKIMEAYYHE